VTRVDRLRTQLATAGRRLRRIARIARWELGQSTSSYNRRTLAVIAVLVVVVASVGTSAVALGVASPSPNTDIYRVGVADNSPYNAVIDDPVSLTARPPDRTALATGEIDLLVGGVRQPTAGPGPRSPTLLVEPADGEKGDAALTAFRSAVQSYNDRAMALESNRTAAYPVIVELQYTPQSTLGPAAPTNAGNLTSDAAPEDDADGGGETDTDANDTATTGTAGDADGDPANGGGDNTTGIDTTGTDSTGSDAPPVADDGGGSLLDLALFGGGTSGYFGDIRPRGASITNNGTSNGTYPFAQLFDTVINVVSQGETRRGHFAGYIDIEHPDVEEWLNIQTEGDAIQTMMYGVVVGDDWMEDLHERDADRADLAADACGHGATG